MSVQNLLYLGLFISEAERDEKRRRENVCPVFLYQFFQPGIAK